MLYRAGDVKWTKGAHLRNCSRKKYVLAKLPNGRITFARSYDDKLTPSPISKITNSYEWGKRTVYRPEDLLTGKTVAGKKLLENRDREIAAVSPGKINPAFRPKQHPLDPLPADEVGECVRTVIGIAEGTLSRHILMEKIPG